MLLGLVIIVCRNNLGLSRACLKTAFTQTMPVDILAVNNASSDGTARFLAAQQTVHRNLYCRTHHRVESVSRVWNEALNWAWERGYNEALVVNNDVELLPQTYRTLLTTKGSCGLITGVSVNRDPCPILPRMLPISPHPDYSCFLITKETHRRVPFDEGYAGAYFEDADHHVRLFRAGILAGSIAVEFRHHRSSTLRFASAAEEQRINQNFDRNKARFLRQYGVLPGTKGYAALFDQGQQSGQHPERQAR